MKTILRKPLICFTILLFLIGILTSMEGQTALVEHYFSRLWYPLFSYAPHAIFGYIPFSIGDICYAVIVAYLVGIAVCALKNLLRKYYIHAIKSIICLLNVLFGLYLYFYCSWGMHYYRAPVIENAGLNTDSIQLADYLVFLEQSLDSTNALRAEINPSEWENQGEKIKTDMEELVRKDTTFQSFLSTTHVRAKSPLNSTLVSYFGVSGYFNPFTHEAHVNTEMPVFSSPFTYVHELAHQQGVGFEDEANFIAYVRLKNHPESFYRYSNYLQTTTYMLQELRGIDEGLFLSFKNRLSKDVLSDLHEEAAFWNDYAGWVNSASEIFYNGYLKHNNQQEGIARYDRMTKLVLAYELKQQGCR